MYPGEFYAQIHLSLKGDKMTIITFERSGGVIGNEIYLDLDVDTMSDRENSLTSYNLP